MLYLLPATCQFVRTYPFSETIIPVPSPKSEALLSKNIEFPLFFILEIPTTLFVTLSNYTKNAQKYLDSTPIIRGINGTELVDLILKYYHDLSDKYKKMIPLKMVYIPVAKDEQA